MPFPMTLARRLVIVISISSVFFLLELSLGLYTGSLALIADAFHYLNDLVGFIVAFIATLVNDKDDCPSSYSFGWQRAKLLGAFFNGVLLLALGVSILLQSMERFIQHPDIDHPMLVMIIGCIGLALNLICASLLHTHDHNNPGAQRCTSDAFVASLNHTHSEHKHELRRTEEQVSMPQHHQHHHHHQHDLGVMGVLLHICGDAINNIGVIAAGAIMWQVHAKGKYYADPAISSFIGLMILISGVPLVKSAGQILLQSAPAGLDPEELRQDLEKVPGVSRVHEMHVWQLNQYKTVASVHVGLESPSLEDFGRAKKIMNECFHAYGVHSVTIQPELLFSSDSSILDPDSAQPVIVGSRNLCSISCGDEKCETLKCCSREPV